MIYKLQKEDYIEIYPFLTPTEIKEEFGSRAHVPATIRKIYTDAGLLPVKDAQREFIKRSFSFSNTDTDKWGLAMLKVLVEKGEEKKSLIRQRIKNIEENYTDEFVRSRSCGGCEEGI